MICLFLLFLHDFYIRGIIIDLNNRKMKRLFFIITLCAGYIFASAQTNPNGQLKFSEMYYDFYTIHEKDGVVSHNFLITNLGEQEVKIISATSSNPALRLELERKSLKKYDKIRLKATLNPTGIRYSFRVPFTVTALCGKDTLKYDLKIGGYIQPAPTTKEEVYSMQEGNLKYKNNTVTIRTMHRNQVHIDTIWFYNVWDSVMTFRPGSIPSAVKILNLTRSLKPFEEGYVVFSFDASVKNDWGFVYDRFTLLTNDPEPKDHNNSKTFYINADIYDNFGSWTPEQMKNAPHILIDEEEFNFGQCTEGEYINHEFTITNIGKSPLVIHKVKTSCGCTTSDLEKDTLQPNESTKIKARFSTYGKKGGQVKEIYIITNDPDQPKVTLKIMGKVLEKPKN